VQRGQFCGAIPQVLLGPDRVAIVHALGLMSP
jgi:hypothetical protein